MSLPSSSSDLLIHYQQAKIVFEDQIVEKEPFFDQPNLQYQTIQDKFLNTDHQQIERDRGKSYKFLLLQVFYKYLKKPQYKQMYKQQEQYLGKLLKRLGRLRSKRNEGFNINLKHFQSFFGEYCQKGALNKSILKKILEQNWLTICKGSSKMKNPDRYIKFIHKIFPEISYI